MLVMHSLRITFWINYWHSKLNSRFGFVGVINTTICTKLQRHNRYFCASTRALLILNYDSNIKIQFLNNPTLMINPCGFSAVRLR